MTSKLLHTSPFEAENRTELSLTECYALLHQNLKPPFPLTIPSPPEYTRLIYAISYAILTQPHLSKTHFTHLVAIVSDGYNLFVTTLVKIVNESYPKLLPSPRAQLIWICSKLIDVLAIGVENLLLSLLRQINGEDLWLPMELIRILTGKWEWISSVPLVLTSALFTFLRLLSLHHHLLSGPEGDRLKRSEIDFCIRVLRECFDSCLKIGRDLIRLLQDLVHIPEFRDLWRDLLHNPSAFGVPGFADISQIYSSRTSSRYFVLRIRPDMEAQLRFLLTHVQWGCQKRYQEWFARKFLYSPEQENVICDIIRFVCCAHHPPNEIIQSNVIPRWAVIGWLLKCCRKNHIEANAKLSLLYDWLFFDEKVDNIMNIEPAILLMMNSIPKYIDITHNLLEFLFLLVDNYDVARKDIIVQGVSSSFNVILRKGVVHSFEALTSCSSLSPLLKQRLSMFLLNSESAHLPLSPVLLNPSSSTSNLESRPSPSRGLQRNWDDAKASEDAIAEVDGDASIHHPPKPMALDLPSPSDVKSEPPRCRKLGVSMGHEGNQLNIKETDAAVQEDIPDVSANLPLNSMPLSSPSRSNVETGPAQCRKSGPATGNDMICRHVRAVDAADQVLDNPARSKRRKIDAVECSVRDLKDIIKESKERGHSTLQKILLSYATNDGRAFDTAVGGISFSSSEALACQITEAFKLNGYKMFARLSHPSSLDNYDDEIQSPTAFVIRTFIFAPHEKMKNLLSFWSKKGQPVGPRLLSYISRLAYETHVMDSMRHPKDHQKPIDEYYPDACILNGNVMTDNSELNSRMKIDSGKLLKCHIDDYISFTRNMRKVAPSSSCYSAMRAKYINELVECAFTAYRGFLTTNYMMSPFSHIRKCCQMEDSSNSISCNGAKEMDRCPSMMLYSDLKSCCGWKAKGTKLLFCSIFCHLPDLSTGKESFIRLLVDMLDHLDILYIQFQLSLKRFSVFGEDSDAVCDIIRSTLYWDFVEQKKLWSLLTSELLVSNVHVGKIVMDLCCGFSDVSENSVAIEGFLTLLRCCPPTLELLTTILSLPPNFGDFATAVLVCWVVSNSSMFFGNLAEWLQNVNKTGGGCSVSFQSTTVGLNHSAIMGLLNFLNEDGLKSIDNICLLAKNISDMKAKLADIIVIHDCS